MPRRRRASSHSWTGPQLSLSFSLPGAAEGGKVVQDDEIDAFGDEGLDRLDTLGRRQIRYAVLLVVGGNQAEIAGIGRLLVAGGDGGGEALLQGHQRHLAVDQQHPSRLRRRPPQERPATGSGNGDADAHMCLSHAPSAVHHHQPFHGEDIGEQHLAPGYVHCQQLLAVDGAEPPNRRSIERGGLIADLQALDAEGHGRVVRDSGHAASIIATVIDSFGMACCWRVRLSFCANRNVEQQTPGTAPSMALMSAFQSRMQNAAPWQAR